ncbi:MAG: decaprenyl-phosphate phosphoribosyltransferase [Anaerolineales bacterium]|jgi:4-hydroxybenzoate polyprenyltransferase|nr:decaprenyl-phosphate phosphoribosyltransferase [Anaerolineales bacterium]
MLLSLLKAMRPKQWAKNVFIFAALIFDRKLTDAPAFLTTLAGVGIFCLLASVIYLINDLSDIEADRQHPKKRDRPIASGALPARVAWTAAGLFLLVAIPSAYLLNPAFFALCLIYLFTNLAYSKWLKHIPLLDVLFLAGFYVLRVGAGVALIEVERFSPWLYVFTTFLALYLGIGKRRAELSQLAGTGAITRRVLQGYTLPFLDNLILLVSATAIVTYSLYTFTAPNLPENHVMMLTIPFVIYAIFRYLYLIQVVNIGDAPEDVVFADRPLQVCMGLWGLVVLVIFYFFPSA